ncbi:hypothetical protein EIP91_003240 [Steccherinum ochraceum]|uniref:Elongation factor methyltransferase 6 n=1 Tax=Steccherinum ochraceum TaxID=92696 RepID=A0A4R0RX14_9APHY|nr:hypothetical protein EIP91_003240 [Steccherinum ochraceum]
MTIEEIALDEQLDLLDPLRHLRTDDDLDGPALVPVQPPTIRNQDIQLSFPSPSTSHPITVTLTVDASPGCGGIAWPAGEVSTSHSPRSRARDVDCLLPLERSGTGLVGLVAGLMGANVWITDQAPLLPIMSRNVALNQLLERVHVDELSWGGPIPEHIPSIDVILAADCVYFEPAFPLLVQTLVDLTSGGHPEILFCYKKRRKARETTLSP